jgi:cyclohexyl-isocyanide hydratase
MNRIAFFVFPRLTLLDLVGVYDVLRRAPGAVPRLIGTGSEVTDESGVTLRADGVYEDLSPFELLVVPGGFGTRPSSRTPAASTTSPAGARSGRSRASARSALIGKAGHLARLRATTHHRSFDLLAPFCREVVRDARVVDEGGSSPRAA